MQSVAVFSYTPVSLKHHFYHVNILILLVWTIITQVGDCLEEQNPLITQAGCLRVFTDMLIKVLTSLPALQSRHIYSLY